MIVESKDESKAWFSMFRSHARQFEMLACRLDSGARPGHVDYISKSDAAEVLRTLAKEQRNVVAVAPALYAACWAALNVEGVELPSALVLQLSEAVNLVDGGAP